MRTVILLPTYNEKENIVSLLEAIRSHVPDVHVLVIDDNSPDGTGDIADKFAELSAGAVSVLHRNAKEGLGKAYVDGYLHALCTFPEAEFFIQMDADFSHDPRYLPELLGTATSCDVVVGSRYVNGISIVNWPLSRLIVSKCGTWFAQCVTGLNITDCTGGFKCFRRNVLESIDLPSIRSNGYVFQIETSFRAWRNGFVLQDFPIIFYDRQRGDSKLHLNIALEALLVVLRLGLIRCFGAPTKIPSERTPYRTCKK